MNTLTKALSATTAALSLSFAAGALADESGKHTSNSIISSAGVELGSGTGTGTYVLDSEINKYTIYDKNTLVVPGVLGLTLDTTLEMSNEGNGWFGTITPTDCYNDTVEACSYVTIGEPIELDAALADGSTVVVEFGLFIVIPEKVEITYQLVPENALDRLIELSSQPAE